MTMTFSLHESIAPNGASEHFDYFRVDEDRPVAERPSAEEFHLLRDKLKIPALRHLIDRPRLSDLMERSIERFPATLISGRAGTGKTAIAASLAAISNDVSWYTVESTDVEWSAFARYFAAALSGSKGGNCELGQDTGDTVPTADQISRFLLRCLSSKYATPAGPSSLIVLDDLHHVFDTPWFEQFFTLLLHSLPSTTHLLMLCRSKPPGPIWRLRSKQMLNVFDEKVITFDVAETKALFDSLKKPAARAAEANEACFGRVSKLLQFDCGRV